MQGQVDDWDWKASLREDLKRLADSYSTDRYPATIETQREYEQELHELEKRTSNDLDRYFAGERSQFDAAYKQGRLDHLNEQERNALDRARRPEDQLALRAGQKGERDALERGSYRQTDDFKEKLQTLVHRQAEDRERADSAFRQVETALNERFGFNRDRGTDRERGR